MDRAETAARQIPNPARLSELAANSASLPVNDRSWMALPGQTLDVTQLGRNRIVTALRSDQAHVHFDMVRTKILQQMRRNNWRSVAITSPTAGCGKTLVALNLAFSLSHQKDCRTLLLDLDLRSLEMNWLLGLRRQVAIARYLTGELKEEQAFFRHADNLAIGVNGSPMRHPSELLQTPQTAEILASMQRQLHPDIVMYDLPAMLEGDELLAFLPNVDCTVLVVAAEDTTVAEIDQCERELSGRTNYLGMILNRCRYTRD